MLLLNSVRYVKNGPGGKWWSVAKAKNQIHAGWRDVPFDALRAGDLAVIEALVKADFEGKRYWRQDFNALSSLIDHPSRHIWITFEDSCMWWCTVRDGVTTPDVDTDTAEHGHFWLTCDRPWSNHSLDGKRNLDIANLPGGVTAAAGFRGTVCEPTEWREILRILRNEGDEGAEAATAARGAYAAAVAKLVARLGWRDFELLVDLILSRTGWARVAKLGGVTEGTDLDVENPSLNERAFVQVKSQAGQAMLDEYGVRFRARPQFDRMIFAVHKPAAALAPPLDPSIQVWDSQRIAELVVRLGLGDWVASRF